MFLSILLPSSSNFDKSVGVKLKNAISEPLANPDNTSMRKINTINAMTVGVGAKNCTSENDDIKEEKSNLFDVNY